MPLTFTGHAEVRLRERGISREDVESALKRPVSRTMPGQQGSIWVFGYDTNGDILKVCVAVEDHTRVITAVRP